MASGDYGKPQYEKQTSSGGGGDKAQNVATQDGGDQTQQLSGIVNHLQRKYASRPWFASAVSQIVPLFDKLDQSNGDTVCLEQHGPNVSIMKQRQTSQGSSSR